jgi:hypothetical protein
MAYWQGIIAGINHRVNAERAPNFKAWRIGLTHDVSKRFEEWGKPENFVYWEADSLADAQAIEDHFINKEGMKGGTGGDLDDRNKVYVYIF